MPNSMTEMTMIIEIRSMVKTPLFISVERNGSDRENEHSFFVFHIPFSAIMNDTEEMVVEGSPSLDGLEEMDLDSDSSWDLRNSPEGSADDGMDGDSGTEFGLFGVLNRNRIDDIVDESDEEHDSDESEGRLYTVSSNLSVSSPNDSEKESLFAYSRCMIW